MQIRINLSKILANAPLTLRSLYIVVGFLVEGPEYVEASNIEELYFYYTQVDIEPDTYLSHHFPKLTSLTLENYNPPTIKPNLSNIRLYEFCVHHQVVDKPGRYFVRISTDNGGRAEKILYYVKKKHCDLMNLDGRFIPAPKTLPLRTTTGSVANVDFICRSVKCIILT